MDDADHPFSADPVGVRAAHFAPIRFDLATGHERSGFFADEDPPTDGRSTITLQAAASCRVDPLDLASYVPTIRVAVERAVPGDACDDGSGLLADATIELTIEECAALVEQLSGPLASWMTRIGWRVDRT